MTNFEAIKEMSVEQMAEIMEHMTACEFCTPHKHSCNKEDCIEANIAWLNSEIPEPHKPMTINKYQELAMRTDNKAMGWDDSLLDSVLGMNGEAGECADIVKKYKFQHHDLDKEHLIEEMGDVLWYIAKCATVLHMDLEDIFRANIAKLEKRYPEGFDVDRSVNRE